VAALSKAWTVFASWNIGIVGSNPSRGMDVCPHLFCVCVVLCLGSGLATGWSPLQGALPTVYRHYETEKTAKVHKGCRVIDKQTNKLRGFSPQSELYRPSNRRLSAKLVATLADRGCRVVSATNPHGREFRFSRPEPLLSFQVAPQLSSRGWVGPVPDPLLLRKSGSAGSRTRDLWIYSQEPWPLGHRVIES
jgi:hypothetical protein